MTGRDGRLGSRAREEGLEQGGALLAADTLSLLGFNFCSLNFMLSFREGAGVGV